MEPSGFLEKAKTKVQLGHRLKSKMIGCKTLKLPDNLNNRLVSKMEGGYWVIGKRKGPTRMNLTIETLIKPFSTVVKLIPRHSDRYKIELK